jgi:hypothetical protein
MIITSIFYEDCTTIAKSTQAHNLSHPYKKNMCLSKLKKTQFYILEKSKKNSYMYTSKS